MKLKPGLGASYAIRPGNGVGLFYSSQTHTGLQLCKMDAGRGWQEPHESSLNRFVTIRITLTTEQ